jgi:hypothetical protein
MMSEETQDKIDAEKQHDVVQDFLEGKDLEGKSAEELVEVIKGERADAQKLLGKYSMSVYLNSGLVGTAKRLVQARVPHPKHDEKSKTFLVYQDEFIDLGNFLSSAETDFHELVMGEIIVPMGDIIAAYEYIMEQRKLTAAEIVKNLNTERDTLFKQMSVIVQQLADSHGKDTKGFEEAMEVTKEFVAEMRGKSGADTAKENIEEHKKDGEHSHNDGQESEETETVTNS